jgi:Cu(I)/Ag(I) efflux system protein CusF
LPNKHTAFLTPIHTAGLLTGLNNPLKDYNMFIKHLIAVTAIIFSTTGFASDVVMTSGEIKRIDTANNKLTIKHGDIANLDMPGMTMVFEVADNAIINAVKKGDKVLFHVLMDGQRMVIKTLTVQP